MIVKGILELFYALITIVFGWINLPNFPDSVLSVIDEFVNILTGAVGLFGIFVDMDVLRICLLYTSPAIGTSHGLYRGAPSLNYELVRELGQEECPLVIHGGTGLAEDTFRDVYKKQDDYWVIT